MKKIVNLLRTNKIRGEGAKTTRKICLFVVAILLLGAMASFVGCAIMVESVELSESQIELKPGESKLVTYNIFPMEASDTKVKWSSSNESVATVNSAGEIVARTEGDCRITITAGQHTDSIDVKVALTPEMLMAEGKYKEAYDKATSDEKNKVLAENVLAVLSEESSYKFKNPRSFMLQEGYYYAWNGDSTGAFGQQAVLHVTGTNSYGAAISSYLVWAYDNEIGEWGFLGSATSTTAEEDDDNADWLLKAILANIMKHGIKLDKSQVKNINAQFEADTLYEVDLIPKEDIDKSSFRTI